MKTYYLPTWCKIVACCMCLFGLAIASLFVWISNDPIALLFALPVLLVTIVPAWPFIATEGLKVPFCYITQQGFQIYRSSMIYWPEVEKVVFKKGPVKGWYGAYLLLHPKSNGQKKGKKIIIFDYWNEPSCKIFSGRLLMGSPALDDMKQEFAKYVPVEVEDTIQKLKKFFK